MNLTISKTDFLLWRDCAKNAWLKKYKPDVFYAHELSDFEKAIIETGNEVETVARGLFPSGILIEGRDDKALATTQKLLHGKTDVIFQPVFKHDGFLAAVDVLKYMPKTNSYEIYEIKASNDVKKEWHPHDLAFQVILLRKCGVNVSKAFILHMNSKYKRQGDLDLVKLFSMTDLTADIEGLIPQIEGEMEMCKIFLSRTDERNGCDCLYKTRSNHCTTFSYSNPHVPEYGVHDISRLGKNKLMELIDSGIYKLEHIPEDFDLSDNQKNQVNLAVTERPMIRNDFISDELGKLAYPLYFLDYETFACSIPRFDGFSPYQHIPFQYSLHIVNKPGSEPEHREFLHIGKNDPTPDFARSLREHLGDKGSVIVWYKPFECGRNREIAQRLPMYKAFLDDIESRIYDLRDVFSKQYYVHKEFKGGTSIKDVLPVLVPGFSYKKLAIQEGGTASQKWNEMALGLIPAAAQKTIAKNLKDYCELDTYAMYAIWKHLHDLL